MLALAVAALAAAVAGVHELAPAELPFLEVPATAEALGVVCLAGALVVLVGCRPSGLLATSLHALAPVRRRGTPMVRPAPLAVPAAGRAPPGRRRS